MLHVCHRANLSIITFALRLFSSPSATQIFACAAVDVRDSSGHTPLDDAIENENRRLFPSLLRAGAALPAESDDAYLRKVIAAGGFRAYERNCLNALAAIFAPKLPRHLPPELVRRVVEYAFHAGDF